MRKNPIILVKRSVISAAKFVFDKVSLYRGHLIRAILIGIAISVIATILAWIGYFRPYQYPLTNLLHLIIQNRANDVVLLFITEEEYKTGFHGISPLSRGRLAELVNVMVNLKARVIALDIDLSDPSPEDCKLSDAMARASAAGVPIVVVGNFKAIEDQSKKEASFSDLRPYTDDDLQTAQDDVILFEGVSPGSQWPGKVVYGGTLFRLDSDWVLRMIEGFYLIKNNDSKYKLPYLRVPSFPVAVVAAYQGLSQDGLVETLLNVQDNRIVFSSPGNDHRKDIHIPMVKGGRFIPNFIGNYEYFNREVNLKGLLEDYRLNQVESETIFKDKIVIIGGTFDKRDFYQTPVGRMSGVEILANSTQSILNGKLITPSSFWKAFAIQVVVGIAVALIFILFSRSWATVICLLALLPGVAIASLLSFSSSYYWFDFVPTVAGVMFYGRIIKAEEALKMMRSKLEIRLEENKKDRT
jgi:CHASE2 domain-containing sensor protein